MSVDRSIFFDVAERGLYLPMKSGTVMPSGYKAIIRAGEREPIVLAVVKNSYKLIKHREVYDTLMPLIKPYETEVRTYFDRDGAKAYIEARFVGVTRGFAGSDIQFRTIFWNGYGGASFGAIIGAVNHFCTNGSVLGDFETTYRRHTAGLDLSIAADWVKEGLKKWEVVNKKWMGWTIDNPTVAEEREAFAAMSDNEQHRARMAREHQLKYIPKYGNTYFALYQTLTDYATHFDDYKQRAVNSNSSHEREMTMLAKAERVMERLAA
jgi:hypothetical protein